MQTTPAGTSPRTGTTKQRPDRRLAILLAAERLFAQHGYHGVSIRQIADEAGVPLALVGYYFGPKEGLIHAILDHWSASIAERMAGLSAVRHKAGRPGYLGDVVDAFLGPVLRLRASTEGEWYALLLTRCLNDGVPETDQAMAAFFDPLAHAFIDALQAAFPGRTRGDVAWAYQFMLGALLHHLSDKRVARLSCGECRPNDPRAATDLHAFITGGLKACLGRSRRSSNGPSTP